MKKVWVLEKYRTPEEMREGYNDMIEMYEECKNKFDADGIAKMEQTLETLAKRIKENPNGVWAGWEGKSVYSQFCDVARDAIRRAPKGTKFRVVEGEIEDDAKYWVKYKFVKENEGVLKYLMATK